MPDQYGFNHLPHWGQTFHGCIEEGCEYPGWGVSLTESQRRRHHLSHTRPRERAVEKQRLQNLAKARRARTRQKEKA